MQHICICPGAHVMHQRSGAEGPYLQQMESAQLQRLAPWPAHRAGRLVMVCAHCTMFQIYKRLIA